jgi:hemoglobin-like flavoprotein
MTQKQIELVKSTWSAVAALDPVVVGKLFYDRLFEIAPQLKPMFRNSMPEQSKKLLATINFVIIKLDALDDIIDEVSKLAQRHINYGVQPGHYVVVGEALLWTLEHGLGELWTEEAEAAWSKCYRILSSAMIAAASYPQQNAA